MDTNFKKPEAKETGETASQAPAEKLSAGGMARMQGLQDDQAGDSQEKGTPEMPLDEKTQADLEEWQRTHDPANWEYKLGSPHADYQASKDIEAANRQHEINQQAATINVPATPTAAGIAQPLGEALATTLAARKESQGEGESPMDQYMREKHGSTPYTTDAYPKEDENEAG